MEPASDPLFPSLLPLLSLGSLLLSKLINIFLKKEHEVNATPSGGETVYINYLAFFYMEDVLFPTYVFIQLIQSLVYINMRS